MPALLHVRLVLDEQHRDAVIAFLRQHAGTANVALVEGAMVEGDGDLVFVDVAREAANDVIGALQAIGVTQIGSLTIEHAELTLGAAADRAHEAAPGDADATVLWPEVDALIETSARTSVDYLAYFVVAALIAAAGVLSDSPVLIVGAMVVGPEYAPIAAMSYGIARGRVDLVAHGMRTFGIGALVGVLVSVTTLPAIAAAGVSIALADWSDLRGSATQLGVNIACLVFVGALTINVLRRATPGRHTR